MSLTGNLVSDEDDAERRVAKLIKISEALMRRVEQATDDSGAAYAHFEKAVMLESQVRDRTRDLERTLQLLNESNARLARANRAEQRARADLSNALEAVQEGFALFGPDDAMVMCNSRFCRQMPDVWPALAEGMSFTVYVDLISRSAALDLGDAPDAAAWAAMRQRLHADQHVMFNVGLKGGGWLQVSEHRTPDGGTAILQTDVTDMVRGERAERDKLLDAQARMIRATLDHINQGVCIFDGEARLLGWNKRLGALVAPPMRLVRLGAGFEALFEHIERDVTFLGDVAARDVRAWVSMTRPRAPLAFDMRQRSGVILSVFAQETPERGFVISFTDVTAEREAVAGLFDANATLERRVKERTEELEDALADAERANASKSRFVAAASHDLLQPLSAAKLFISALEKMELEGEPSAVAQRAQNALGSVESILGALLDISKLDSGKATVERGAVPLARLLGQLQDEFAPVAAGKGLRLRFAPTAAVVDSDNSYLRRILQNLIGNAVRYTERGGVLVGVRSAGAGRVRVEVWDTGPGVPEDRQAEIFKEFRRLDAEGSAAEGMGLGLTIVERACKLLGHRLKMDSVPGRGTRFSVLADLAPEPGRAAATGGPRPAVRAGLLALIVMEDAEVSAALALLLETWGVAAFETRSGREALTLLDETGVSPDLMLVDHALGAAACCFDAIAAVRGAHGDMPAAVIAADEAAGAAAECARLDLPLLAKPVRPEEVQDFIARMA